MFFLLCCLLLPPPSSLPAMNFEPAPEVFRRQIFSCEWFTVGVLVFAVLFHLHEKLLEIHRNTKISAVCRLADICFLHALLWLITCIILSVCVSVFLVGILHTVYSVLFIRIRPSGLWTPNNPTSDFMARLMSKKQGSSVPSLNVYDATVVACH